MKIFKDKYMLELQEDLYRTEFAIAHDKAIVPMTEDLLKKEEERAEALRLEWVDMDEKGKGDRTKAHREAMKAKFKEWGIALNGVKDIQATLGQINQKVMLGERKAYGLKERISFLEKYEASV